MKAEEFRNLTADELEAKARSFRKELYDLRVQAIVGKLEKSSKLKAIKRDLARVLTIRREWSAQEKRKD